MTAPRTLKQKGPGQSPGAFGAFDLIRVLIDDLDNTSGARLN